MTVECIPSQDGGPTWALEQALAAIEMCDRVNAWVAWGEPRQGVLL